MVTPQQNTDIIYIAADARNHERYVSVCVLCVCVFEFVCVLCVCVCVLCVCVFEFVCVFVFLSLCVCVFCF